MSTAELKSDGRRLALMTTWAVMKDGEAMIGGHVVKKRVPVLGPNGASLVLNPGVLFNSESQAKDTLHCSSEDVAEGIRVGALQWRTPQAAQRLIDTPGFGNQAPQVGFGDEPTPEGGGDYKDQDLDNLSLSSGENLTYSPQHLSKQDVEWKRAELARQRPKRDVEAMDESMLDECLSENYKG